MLKVFQFYWLLYKKIGYCVTKIGYCMSKIGYCMIKRVLLLWKLLFFFISFTSVLSYVLFPKWYLSALWRILGLLCSVFCLIWNPRRLLKIIITRSHTFCSFSVWCRLCGYYWKNDSCIKGYISCNLKKISFTWIIITQLRIIFLKIGCFPNNEKDLIFIGLTHSNKNFRQLSEKK